MTQDSKKIQMCYRHYSKESMPKCVGCHRGTLSYTGHCGKCGVDSQSKIIMRLSREKAIRECGLTYKPKFTICPCCETEIINLKAHTETKKHKYRSMFINPYYTIGVHLSFLTEMRNLLKRPLKTTFRKVDEIENKIRPHEPIV
jgi:hypothetical protein